MFTKLVKKTKNIHFFLASVFEVVKLESRMNYGLCLGVFYLFICLSMIFVQTAFSMWSRAALRCRRICNDSNLNSIRASGRRKTGGREATTVSPTVCGCFKD